MAEVKWIKITTDIFDDEKILLIESLPDSYAIIVVWFKLLCLAGKQNNSGVFMMSNKIAYTDKMLATIFRMKEATVTMALQTFEQFGMIEIIDGIITIPNWGKHQNLDQLESKKEYMRNYMQGYREKQKAITSGEISCKTNSKTNSKTNVSRAEKEEDEESDKEKEIHSFILSRESEEEKTPEERAAEQRRCLQGIGEGVVFLSDEQIGSLLDELTVEEFDHYVKVIAECEKSGKRFRKKTHYDAILEMARKDRKIEVK